MLKGKREKFMELLFQKEEKLHAVLSHNQFKESICFNTHNYPKPQIYIGLGEKKN